MKKFKALITTAIFIVMLLSLSLSVFAYSPYRSYNYNFYGDPITSPQGYVPDKVVFGSDIGIDIIDNASDLYVFNDEEIYIVDLGGDNGNGRIIILDKNFKLIKTIEKVNNNGKIETLKSPNGIIVDENKNIYVCDTGNKRVLKLDQNGKVLMNFKDPNPKLVGDEFSFTPMKVELSINGSLYVIASGQTDGIMEFDKNGEFIRFFGAPKVKLTASDIINMYWRKIYRSFSAEEGAVFVDNIPIEFKNFYVDYNGFVYCIIPAAENPSTNEVSKLNFTGTNVLNPVVKSTKKINDTLSANYGDLVIRGNDSDNVFADITTDDDGFFTIIDSYFSRIFEYDSEGNLIFVYGSKGQQLGNLTDPIAVEKLGEDTLVLDNRYGCIIKYKLSEYGKQLHKAVVCYQQGRYDDALEPWNEILRMDANSELAHIGIGKVYMNQKKYEEALSEFKLANDRGNYSTVYKLYREQVIRNNFAWIATSLVLLIILVVAIRIIIKKVKGGKK